MGWHTTYDHLNRKKEEYIEIRVTRWYACGTCDKRYLKKKKSKKCCKPASPIISPPADPLRPRS